MSLSQADLNKVRATLGSLDADMSKMQQRLTAEHAMAAASQAAKDNILERMTALMRTVEILHVNWKDEQEQRMSRQHALYEKSDEARTLRLEALELKAANRCARPRLRTPFSEMIGVRDDCMESCES